MTPKAREDAVWIARYWARRFYESSGDTQQMWFYLFLAEAVQQGEIK